MKNLGHWQQLCLLSFLSFCFLGAAQHNPENRRQYIDSRTRTTDDPRRIPRPAAPSGPEGSIVLRGGRIFDGTGAAAYPGTLVIRRNRIEKIISPNVVDWPKDASVIDVTGNTILPGLIDAHTHIDYVGSDTPWYLEANEADAMLRAVERARFFLECGITSVRDVGSLGEVPFRLKEWISQNRVPGPRIFACGAYITATGGHGAEGLDIAHPGPAHTRLASGQDGWREAVREQFSRGADLIKIGSHFSREEVRACVEEAHALGLKVACDAETFYIQWAVEAGVDTIEHPLPRTDETIRLMAEMKTAAVPTLIPYIYIFDSYGGYFGSTSRRFSFSKEANFEVLRRMKRAGVHMGIGTDLVTDRFRYLPAPYISELEQFVAAGYSIGEALVAATRTNAEILDMNDKLGTLEPGKLADISVFAGKPDERLGDLSHVAYVIRDGYLVVKDGLVVVSRHVPLPVPQPRRPS
jgi:imidazolonepropionase-like amidohydrolase